MKKLTAGIFATLLTVVAVDGAYAAIASKQYVDDINTELTSSIADKADASTVTELQGTVSDHTTQIGAINTALESKVDDADITDMQIKSNMVNTAGWADGKTDDTKYPSAAAVNNAITAATKDIASNEAVQQIQTDLDTAEGEIDTLQTQMAGKANTADLGDLATLDAVGSDQITDGSVATADIANKAVTEAKLSDTVNASLDKAESALQKTTADAAYAVKALEGQVGVVSATNMGTTATTVVTAIKEVAGEAADAATAAAGAKTAADTAQGEVDALEGVVNHATTGLAAAHTAIDAVEGRVTAAEGEIDDIQAEMDTMATTETVTNLTNRVTTAEGDITVLETAVNNAESGLAATNAIADQALADAATAQSAAEAAQRTADAKQDKLTGTIGGSMQPVYLNDGTITAGTALGTLATKSTVTDSEVADGALAQSKINGLATSLAAKLTTPPTSAKGETGLYVLTYDGTNFQWEDIARTVE